MQKHRSSWGYTLIELLLVIAIISIIAALGIMTYRRYYLTQRVEKVALEMQHVVEAAMAYNVDNGEWPDANNATPNCIPAQPMQNKFVANYLPNNTPNSYTTSFGNHYCWDTVKPTLNSGLSQSAAKLFWVAVQVPNGDVNMAKRIAARLPNAVVTAEPSNTQETPVPCVQGGSTCYVRTEVVQPSQTSNASAGASIAALGHCRPNKSLPNSGGGLCANNTNGDAYHITFNACSSGTPSIYMLPDLYHMPNRGKSSKYGLPITGINADQVSCSNVSDSNGQEYCNATFSIRVCYGSDCNSASNTFDAAALGGTEGAAYVVTCVPEQNNNHM